MQFQSFSDFRSQSFDSISSAFSSQRQHHHQIPAVARSQQPALEQQDNSGLDYERLLALDEHNVPRGIPKTQQRALLKSVICRSKDQQCSVCLEPLAVGRSVVELSCRHNFHEKCITPWIERSPTCPTCRAEVKKH